MNMMELHRDHSELINLIILADTMLDYVPLKE